MARVRRVASERTPLSSATPAPDAAGQEAGVSLALVMTNRALHQRLTPQKQGNLPKGKGSTDPRNGGHRPQNRTGNQPKDWLFKYPTRYFKEWFKWIC